MRRRGLILVSSVRHKPSPAFPHAKLAISSSLVLIRCAVFCLVSVPPLLACILRLCFSLLARRGFHQIPGGFLDTPHRLSATFPTSMGLSAQELSILCAGCPGALLQYRVGIGMGRPGSHNVWFLPRGREGWSGGSTWQVWMWALTFWVSLDVDVAFRFRGLRIRDDVTTAAWYPRAHGQAGG